MAARGLPGRCKRTALICAAVLPLLGSVCADDSPLTLVSWGGAYMEAQRAALFDPFEKRFGQRIVAKEYAGDLAPLQAQAAVGKIEWDVVAVDRRAADQGCQEGLFEPLPAADLPPGLNHTPAKDDFFAAALHECALGGSVRALLFFHLDDTFETAPQTVAETFDVTRFPGMRALPRTPRGNLEWALIADGVPPQQVYAELQQDSGIERAFAQLTRLRPHIVWWREVTEAVRALTDGTVSLAAAYHDAVAQLVIGTPVAVVPVWSGQLWEIDYWAIVKGAPQGETARKFLAFATGTLAQVEFARLSAHGPVRRSALGYTQDEVAVWLPSAKSRLALGLHSDTDWWLRNETHLNTRFRQWWRDAR